MDKYGLTEKGINIKRLDVILDELHDDLSVGWGKNTRQNQNSLLNHLLVNIADKLAELWELGEDVYYSQSPMTAEGLCLDYAAQLGGVAREEEMPSYYNILCTGVDGTTVPSYTTVATDTNPPTNLKSMKQFEITRNAFNKVKIRFAKFETNSSYSIVLNGNTFTYTSKASDGRIDVLNSLKYIINLEDFDVSVDVNNELLLIESTDRTSSNALILTENLTTESVSTIAKFETEEKGDIYLPEGIVTKIVKSASGLTEVSNVGSYVAGRKTETDTEFRQSYYDKIFARSSMMIKSIVSAIINNCPGVTSAVGYENCDDVTDADGRPPHSIELIVGGGDEIEIAQQILNKKAGGINTFGAVVIDLIGEGGETIPIRFNRPNEMKLWFVVTITTPSDGTLPLGYSDAIKNIIIDNVDSLSAGEDIFPQRTIMPEIYKMFPNITYMDINIGCGNEKPSAINEHCIEITARDKAFTEYDCIEVRINE